MSDCRMLSSVRVAKQTAEAYLDQTEQALDVGAEEFGSLSEAAYDDLIEDLVSLKEAIASDDPVAYAAAKIIDLEANKRTGGFTQEGLDLINGDLFMWNDIHCASGPSGPQIHPGRRD